ncbi:MAG: hypothetical protein SFX73_37340 [Kofleriaceae bacterium]|nr:hypothetical protein [Kofleriaceae bacterium]
MMSKPIGLAVFAIANLVACTEKEPTDADPVTRCPQVSEEPLFVEQELIYDARLLAAATGGQELVIRLFSETQLQPPALVVDLFDPATEQVVLARATAAVSNAYTVVSTGAFRFVDDWPGESAWSLLVPGAAKPQQFALTYTEDEVLPVGQGSVLRIRATDHGSDQKSVDALMGDPWLGAVEGGVLTIQTPQAKPLTEPAIIPVKLAGRWLEWRLAVPEVDAEKLTLRIRALDASGKDRDGVEWEIDARLGSGTRTSAGQANNKAELL